MISVIIPTHNAEATLARVFSPLIGPTVRGFITEVLVLDEGSSDETRSIAEATGADVVGVGVIPKSEWVLLLPQDAVLGPGWDEEAEWFIEQVKARRRDHAAVFAFHSEALGSIARLSEKWIGLQGALFGRPHESQAILIGSRGFLAANSRAPEKLLKGKKRTGLRTATTQISG